MSHTPIKANEVPPPPWKKVKSGNPMFTWAIVAADRGSVCFLTRWGSDEETADTIIREHHSHAGLVDALRLALARGHNCEVSCDADIDTYLAALAAAEEG